MTALSVPVSAGWLLTAEYAGFLGRYSLGVGYIFKERHAVEFSIGSYDGAGQSYQSNLLYRYSRWKVPLRDKMWIPIQIGIFVIRSWDNDNYFNNSPQQYPEENYYESTLMRGGIEFGTTLQFTEYNFGVAYRYRLLDNGIVANYNNSNRDLQYYTSSGLGLQYYF